MTRWYLRDGTPVDDIRRIDGLLGDIEYKSVARTDLQNGMWVSTIWLGLDHRYGKGPPLIFETMVFPADGSMIELDADRYSTEEQAIAGHQRMVEKWEVEK